MRSYKTFFVGTEDEVSHHNRPYSQALEIRVIEPDKASSEASVGDVAIFYSEHFDRFRQAWHELKSIGCHTLYAVDGILEWRNAWQTRPNEPACPWTMRPVLSDKVACIGASQARVLDSWGNLGKTEVVGVPRFDSLQKLPRRMDIDTFRVLIMTAKWPGFTAGQIELAIKSLTDLKQYAAKNPAVNGRRLEFVWRLTKNLDLIVDVRNRLRNTDGTDLASTLADVDAVVTTPSTTLLESMLCGRPTGILDYTNSPRYVDAAWSISAAEQIPQCLREMADPPAEKMSFQESILRDALGNHEKAAERMIQLVEGMKRVGHDCRHRNEPVAFPRHILPIEDDAVSLDLSAVYPQLSQTTGEDPIELKAHLAETRRTIERLEARIDFLQAELEKADHAFQRIHDHPIAGRVIRWRQRLLDLLASKKVRKPETSDPGREGQTKSSNSD